MIANVRCSTVHVEVKVFYLEMDAFGVAQTYHYRMTDLLH